MLALVHTLERVGCPNTALHNRSTASVYARAGPLLRNQEIRRFTATAHWNSGLAFSAAKDGGIFDQKDLGLAILTHKRATTDEMTPSRMCTV